MAGLEENGRLQTEQGVQSLSDSKNSMMQLLSLGDSEKSKFDPKIWEAHGSWRW